MRLRVKEPPKIDTKAYGLKGQLARVVHAANKSPDAVALITLGTREDSLEGAIVILRGHDTVALFTLWAVRNGVLDPNQTDGLVDALEGKKGDQRNA